MQDPNQAITLNEEQAKAVATIKDWYLKARSEGSTNALKGVSQFRLGGYAGTGKTTLIRHLLLELRASVSVCAFTGKAAFVLRRKGIPASTIHSLIYEPHVDDDTKEMKFVLKTSTDLQCDLIIVDEASMISHELYHDLKSFHKPMLFIGDPGQLEPVSKSDNPGLMLECDMTLTQIHRQALNSPIIGLATAIRQGGKTYDPRRFGTHGDDVVFRNKNVPGEVLHGVDQIIAARNITRVQINNRMRANLGYNVFDGLHEGEKLMVLKNDSELGLCNGQIVFVERIREEKPLYFTAVITVEGLEGKREVPIWSEPFYRELGDRDRPPKGVAKCDFGYCITCHKAQGSEWEKVLVIDEWLGRLWDMGRWRYTAVTRASSKLIFAI